MDEIEMAPRADFDVLSHVPIAERKHGIFSVRGIPYYSTGIEGIAQKDSDLRASVIIPSGSRELRLRDEL
jgi:hypothetical protein